jgi:hypothetical protein
MKRTLLILAVVAVSALTMYGQGRVNFNNLISGNTISVTTDPTRAAAGQGAAGAFVGANYSIQVLWAAGTFTDLGAFMAANPSSSTPFAFFGATGGSPTTDGAGLFDGGTVATGGPAGAYTMLARAWYNGGTYATYAAATAPGVIANFGDSGLFGVNVTASPTPAPNTTFPSFTVGTIIPEPSTFVLAGLGIASLLLFRRRK